MSTSDNQSWGNAPVGIGALVLIVLLIWFFADGRPFFRHTGRDLRSTVRDAGQDLRSTGRDAAASIRDTVR